MSEQYSMLGAFLWDYNYVPFLSILYGGVKKKFLLHRRYTQQGLGKCMVTYLNNKAKHKQSTGATENAIASTVQHMRDIGITVCTKQEKATQ
jgi:hypothetical protein